MPLILRAARPGDYAALATWIPGEGECVRWAGPLLPFPCAAHELAARLNSPGISSLVLTDADSFDDATLGFGQFWMREPNSVHLGRIIVAPALRGRGYGKALCRLLLDAALQTTCVRAATLRVFRDNGSAMNLYRGLGFEPVEELSDDEVLVMRYQASARAWSAFENRSGRSRGTNR